jgi:hypothetical protein
MYGFAQKSGYKFMRPTNEIFKKSTDKKVAALMYSRVFLFYAKTLAKNISRYTNNHEPNGKEGAMFRATIVQMFLDSAKKLDV